MLPVSLTLTATVSAEAVGPVRLIVNFAGFPSLTDSVTAAIVTAGRTVIVNTAEQGPSHAAACSRPLGPPPPGQSAAATTARTTTRPEPSTGAV